MFDQYSFFFLSVLELIATSLDRLIRENDTVWDPEEISISSLLAESYFSIVDHHLMSESLEVFTECDCFLEMISDDNDNMRIGGNIRRPDQASFVIHLLGNHPHEA